MNHSTRFVLLLAALAPLAACGSDGSPVPVDNYGPMTAQVGNVPFNGLVIDDPEYAGNRLTLAGLEGFGTSTARQIDIEINPITGPGTFTFGVGSTNTALYAAYDGQAISLWGTGQVGGGGTVTITQVTPTRMVGTFAFNMGPTPGTPATGAIQVTQGSFDVTYIPR